MDGAGNDGDNHDSNSFAYQQVFNCGKGTFLLRLSIAIDLCRYSPATF